MNQAPTKYQSPYKIAFLLFVFNYVFIMSSIQGGLDESSPYNIYSFKSNFFLISSSFDFMYIV
jgi:hypothetical protein